MIPSELENCINDEVKGTMDELRSAVNLVVRLRRATHLSLLMRQLVVR